MKKALKILALSLFCFALIVAQTSSVDQTSSMGPLLTGEIDHLRWDQFAIMRLQYLMAFSFLKIGEWTNLLISIPADNPYRNIHTGCSIVCGFSCIYILTFIICAPLKWRFDKTRGFARLLRPVGIYNLSAIILLLNLPFVIQTILPFAGFFLPPNLMESLFYFERFVLKIIPVISSLIIGLIIYIYFLRE